MAYVVSFADFQPEPRYDGVPWASVQIEESDSRDGPWTIISTQLVSPLDVDPAHPQSRSFSTDQATLQDGWYRITFSDANGVFQLPVAPIHSTAIGEASFLPTIQQVANHILSRTKDKYGNEVGTFNANTRPTDTQVLNIISDAATDVADIVGDDLPAELWDDAANVIAERAAMKVETSFYSEQLNTNRSPYPQLKEQYEEDILSLARNSGGEGPPTGTGNVPQYSFPDSQGWMTRRM